MIIFDNRLNQAFPDARILSWILRHSHSSLSKIAQSKPDRHVVILAAFLWIVWCVTAEEFLKPVYPEFLVISRRNKGIKQDYTGYITVTSEITMRFFITPKKINNNDNF